MSTKPDVVLTPDTWLDLNTASGIAVGTEMIVQSKSSHPVLIWLGSTPPPNLTDGYVIDSTTPMQVTAGEAKVWALGFGPVSLQD